MRKTFTTLLVGWAAVGIVSIALGACSDATRRQDADLPGGSGAGTPSGASGAGGNDTMTGSCEPGDVRSCKIDIDERNCFVGEQRCQAGLWGPCEDADGLSQKSIGPQSTCTGNPCNPLCEAFDEDPTPDLEANGTPPPTNASGTIGDVPASVFNACINDTTSACGNNCTSSGYCQLDTRCVNPPGSTCVPWADGQFATGSGDPDFTIKVSCDGSTVTVCNRGDAPGGSTTGISVWTPNQALCGGAGCNQALSTGMSSVATLRGTCPIPADIMPGQCEAVPCDMTGNPASYLHVNGCDEFTCEPESDVNNNWGYFNNSIGCTCSQGSTSATLQTVSMYLMLDSSGSMGAMYPQAKQAVADFVQAPASRDLTLAFRIFGSGCNNSGGSGGFNCSNPAADACGIPFRGPNALSNDTFRNDLEAFVLGLGNSSAGTPHRPIIREMSSWGVERKTTHPGETVALVYITDGSTGNTCGYNGSAASRAVRVQPAADAFASDGVLFFTVALNGANMPLLDDLAAAGGTTSAIDLRAVPDASLGTTLAMELASIQGNLLSCTVPIPNAATVDPATVAVTYEPSAGADRPLTQVADAAACTAGDQFYFSPDAANPTDIVMCDTICSTVRADTAGSVTFSGGCVGGYVEEQHVFTYTADCSAYPAGSAAFWDFLRYDTTIPTGAQVRWEISTSNVDEATAAMGPWTEVAVADAANPDRLPGNEVDLRAALGTAAAQGPYLALRITVTPDPSGSNTPTVDDWDLQLSCDFNE